MSEKERLEALLAEQEELQFARFDAAIAWRLGSMIHAEAAKAGMRIAIEISKPNQILFFCAMPGATPDNAAWVRRKRMVVERFHRSSLYMKLSMDEAGRNLFERYNLSPDDYASSGGSVPIMVRGTGCVGAVTVSGLTQYDDHQLGAEAIRTLIAEMHAEG
ncbi:MAG TPA: heme-degrading domain-containing protein [Devosiaceae bacterium]|nr:heme-degrading domain-containing protein [Devosiaceae bacterium]